MHAAGTSADRRAILNHKRGVPIIAVSGGWRFVPNCFCLRSSEALMKAILSAAMVLGLCGLAGARDEKANPVGTWPTRDADTRECIGPGREFVYQVPADPAIHCVICLPGRRLYPADLQADFFSENEPFGESVEGLSV